MFKSSVWKGGSSPWEIRAVKGRLEVKVGSGSGIWDPRSETVQWLWLLLRWLLLVAFIHGAETMRTDRAALRTVFPATTELESSRPGRRWTEQVTGSIQSGKYGRRKIACINSVLTQHRSGDTKGHPIIYAGNGIDPIWKMFICNSLFHSADRSNICLVAKNM